MIRPNYIDEINCGSFFDHIDDLLDFPVEDVDPAALPTARNSNSLGSTWPADSHSLHGSDSVFSGNTASDLSAELSVPVSESKVIITHLHQRMHMPFLAGSQEVCEFPCKNIRAHSFVHCSCLVALGLLNYTVIAAINGHTVF